MRRVQWPAQFAVLAVSLSTPVWAQTSSVLPPSPARPAPKPTPVLEPPAGIAPAAPRIAGAHGVLVLLSSTPAPEQPSLRRAEIREEATSLEYYTRYGGGSLTASLQVNCETEQFQLESFVLYPRNNLSGEPVSSIDRRSVWQTPGRDTVMAKAVALTCRTAPRRTPPSPQQQASVTRAMQAPSQPPSTAPERATQRSGAWTGAVQVNASGSDTSARAALDMLSRQQPALMAGLGARVARAEVNRATVFRSLVVGFADRTAALAFCRSLSAAGSACFLRE